MTSDFVYRGQKKKRKKRQFRCNFRSFNLLAKTNDRFGITLKISHLVVKERMVQF